MSEIELDQKALGAGWEAMFNSDKPAEFNRFADGIRAYLAASRPPAPDIEGLVERAAVKKVIDDWQAECSDHPALWNQANVLRDRLAALRPVSDEAVAPELVKIPPHTFGPARYATAEEKAAVRGAVAYLKNEPVVTDEMANAALSRQQDKDLDLLTNTNAMREIIRAALAQSGKPAVKALVWHKSHMPSWNDDWHTTTPIIYTVRCADENGWKWSFHGGQGYERSAEAAKAAAQADYEARIRSALQTGVRDMSARASARSLSPTEGE